jgi:hypothetical protein
MRTFEVSLRFAEAPGTRRASHRLARFCNWLLLERPWRAQEEADPLSAFDRDPDDGPESEGLMHYER